jgi:hypothetical protein
MEICFQRDAAVIDVTNLLLLGWTVNYTFDILLSHVTTDIENT